MSSDDLRVGFYKFTPHNMNIGGCAPAPGSIQIVTIGGPRTLKQIEDEIAACERTLAYLKSEMSGHPDYRKDAAVIESIPSKNPFVAVAVDRNGYRHDWVERCRTEDTGCERFYRADEVDREIEWLRALIRRAIEWTSDTSDASR